MVLFGSFWIKSRRKILGGKRSAISREDEPAPLDEDIFLPPTLKNSYGILRGGSRLKTSREKSNRCFLVPRLWWNGLFPRLQYRLRAQKILPPIPLSKAAWPCHQ